jgi:hypothetical protein
MLIDLPAGVFGEYAKKAHLDVSSTDFKKALDHKIKEVPSAVNLSRVTRSFSIVSAVQ